MTDHSPSPTQTGDDLAKQVLDAANAVTVTAPTSDDTAQATSQPNAQLGETLIALQNLIERNANELDRIKEEIRVQRESLKNIFENDEALAEAEQKATAFTQELKQHKSRVKGNPVSIQTTAKIGELNEQKKEVEEALNNHLLNLYQVTGAKTFDTSDGEQREFKIRASIVGSKKVLLNEQ